MMGAPQYKSAPKIFELSSKKKKLRESDIKREKAEIARLKSLIQDKLKSKEEIKKAALILSLLLQSDKETNKDR
jgi:hypothetical protein